MAVPHPIYPPPFNITRASHVVLRSKDLGASRAFYVDALGFVVSDEDSNALYLRGVEEACHHSLVILSGTEPCCERVGFRVYLESELEAVYRFFAELDLNPEWADRPFQGKTLHMCDAVGTPIEICARMDVRSRMIVSFENHFGGAPHRLDHFQILTPHVQKACNFYSNMGFRLSEYIAVDNTDDLVFVFMQRKGNPHDVVFASGVGPRLHHAAYTVPDVSHVIQACDVAGRMGFGAHLEHGPGRHGPGHAMFVYFRDPDGHRIELFTTHYQTMDVENEPVRWDVSYMRNRPWGLPPKAKWYSEASVFSGREVEQPAFKATPISLETVLLYQNRVDP